VSAANKVRRGDIRHAVVVRAAKEIRRKDGTRIKFDDNACVLVNKSGEPIGTRLNGESFCGVMPGGTVGESANVTCYRSRCGGIEDEGLVEDLVARTGSCIKACCKDYCICRRLSGLLDDTPLSAHMSF